MAAVDITPAGFLPVNIIDDYYKWAFITPNEDCFVYVQWGESGTVIRVGSPQNIFWLISPYFEEHMTIAFRQITFDGVVLNMGHMSEMPGLGLYYIPITTGMNESFIEADGDVVHSLYDYINMYGMSADMTITMEDVELTISMDLCDRP